jgi:hypothetical protein
MIDYNQES